MEDIYSTKTAAMTFVHELCKARAKGSLDMLMAVSGRRRRGGRTCALCRAGAMWGSSWGLLGWLATRVSSTASFPPPQRGRRSKRVSCAPGPCPPRSTWWAC